MSKCSPSLRQFRSDSVSTVTSSLTAISVQTPFVSPLGLTHEKKRRLPTTCDAHSFQVYVEPPSLRTNFEVLQEENQFKLFAKPFRCLRFVKLSAFPHKTVPQAAQQQQQQKATTKVMVFIQRRETNIQPSPVNNNNNFYCTNRYRQLNSRTSIL